MTNSAPTADVRFSPGRVCRPIGHTTGLSKGRQIGITEGTYIRGNGIKKGTYVRGSGTERYIWGSGMKRALSDDKPTTANEKTKHGSFSKN